MFQKVAGLSDVAMAKEFETDGSFDSEAAEATPAVVFPSIGVAVVTGDPQQMNALSAEMNEDSEILAIEPERIMYALPEGGLLQVPPPITGGISLEYLRGYRDAITLLYDHLISNVPGAAGAEEFAQSFADDTISTWGLKATRISSSKFSGRGVKIAVLDTGLDLTHPDFVGRSITAKSFIAGQDVQDGHGHGTHCIGTACGSKQPGFGRRYGIAFRADILAGKVLSNAGSGADTGILAGIEWALSQGAQVISMSLGAPVQPGETFSQVYEHVARRCLAAGTLIVAAAGNESRNRSTGGRLEPPAPVGRPANCPSILAVGAVDPSLRVAPFSNGGINPTGGGVDIAAPGVGVYSSWPMPTRTNTISGTSMATPHVAGIAALWAEARGVTGGALWQLLTGSAHRLTTSSRDVGAGLAQAPQ